MLRLRSLFLACDGPVLPESESGRAPGNGKVRSSVSVPDTASGSSLSTMGRDRGAQGPPARRPPSTSASTAPTRALAKVTVSSGGTGLFCGLACSVLTQSSFSQTFCHR